MGFAKTKVKSKIGSLFADACQASILRGIVASPRLKHAETGLDLCYVTDDSGFLFLAFLIMAGEFLFALLFGTLALPKKPLWLNASPPKPQL